MRDVLSEDRVRQAIQEAIDRGLVGFDDLRVAADQYGGRTKQIIDRYIRENAL